MKKGIKKEMALSALNNFFKNQIQPVELSQTVSINPNSFQKWIKDAALGAKTKSEILSLLKPLVDNSSLGGVILKNAKSKTSGIKLDMAIVDIPIQIKLDGLNSDIFVIYASEDDEGNDGGGVAECQYKSCFCANKNNCSCTSTTSNRPAGGDCPTDECSSDSDCGGNDDEEGLIDIHDVLGAF